MEFSCPRCGKVRNFRPATIAKLKTRVCRDCIDKEWSARWVTIKCKQCGRERKIPPYESKRGNFITQSCAGCPRHTPGVLPDTFDAGYVLGTILGDGSLVVLKQKQGWKQYLVKLSVTSKAFADRFKGHLAACTGKMPWTTIHTSDKKGNTKIGMPACRVTEHIVSLTNRDWYDRLKPYKKDREFGDIPARSEAFRRGFVQGMLDSEGYQNPKYIDIANKDRSLLESVVVVLKSLGEPAKIYGPYARGVFHLRMKPRGWVKTVG